MGEPINITLAKLLSASSVTDDHFCSRVQRLALLESSTFHEQLLLIACGHGEPAEGEASEQHRQKLALDILTWILAVQMNDPTR